MKKAIIPLSLAILAAIALFIYLNRFVDYTRVEVDGYIFSNDAIYDNLYMAKETEEVSVEKVKVNDVIYKSNDTYYVGDTEKKSVNLKYPIVSKDSSTLYIVSNVGDLVADDFGREVSYSGTLITDSKLYNTTDYEQATNYDYYFVALNNGLFINLSEMTIDTYEGKCVIPLNSFINFSSNSLNYYYMANDEYVYVNYPVIDSKDKVILEDFKGTYKQLLINLSVIQDDTKNPDDPEDPTDPKNQKNNDDENEDPGKGDINQEDPTNETGNSKPEYIHKPEPKPTEEKPWVAPEVTITSTYAKTYSYNGLLNISDPSSVITKSPTFEFSINDSVALRKTSSGKGAFKIAGLLPSTNYKVVAYYEYADENNVKRRKMINFNGKDYFDEFTTEGIDNLNVLNFELGNITTDENSFTISNIKLTNDINDEVMNGIKGVSIRTADGTFVLTGTEVKYLSNKVDFSYTSAKILKTNKQYEGEIIVSDTAGNQLNTTNSNRFNFKTKQKAPVAKMNVQTSKDFRRATLSLNITNSDNVNVSEYHYIMYDELEQELKRASASESVTSYILDGLDTAKKYIVKAYASYTTDDNYSYENVEIGKLEFVSFDIEKLGNIPFTVQRNSAREDNITSTSASINVFYSNYDSSDPLYGMIHSETDDDGNYIKGIIVSLVNTETGQIEYSKVANPNDFIVGKTFDIYYEEDGKKLKSNTEYEVVIEAKVLSGSKEIPIKTTINSKGYKFKTLKQKAYVSLKNIYIADGYIDFDAYVIDPDSAILDGDEQIATTVNLEVYNSSKEKVYSDIVEISHTSNADELTENHMTINSLPEGATYNFVFKALSYNDNVNSESNKVLEGSNSFNLSGLNSTIEIQEMIKTVNFYHDVDTNLFDITDIGRWKSTIASSYNPTERLNISSENNSITLGAYNGYRVYSYYLPELRGKSIALSFKAKRGTDRTGRICIMNNITSNTSSCVKNLVDTSVDNYDPDEYIDYNNITFTLNSTGYISFYIAETDNQFFTNSIILKDIQIEAGETSSVDSYKSYDDSSGYIGTFNINGTIVNSANDRNPNVDVNEGQYEYYVSLIKNGVRDRMEKFDTEDREFDSTSGITNSILFDKIVKDEEYEVSFSVYDRDLERYYDLDNVAFETDNEIRVIRNASDYLNMHKSGYYIAVDDIYLTSKATCLNICEANGKSSSECNNSCTGNYESSYYSGTFDGILDMQGHQINIETKGSRSYIMANLGGGGILRNADIHYYLNKTSAASSYYGLISDNYGTIQNMKMTIEESVDVSNYTYALTCNRNFGTIENFIYYSKAPVYGYRKISLGCTANYGTMKNGYAYSDPGVYAIDVSKNIPNNDGNNKETGIFAQSASNGSVMENIYSTDKINIGSEPNTKDKQVGSLIGSASSATIRNIYVYDDSTEDDMLENKRDTARDIMFGSASNINYSNLHYISEVAYSGTYAKAQQLTALKNVKFQNNTINSEKKFLTDKAWRLNIYPLLDLPDCMPTQDYITLPSISGEDLKFLAVDNIEYLDDDYEAKITLSFYNPKKLTIRGVKIDGIATVDMIGKSTTNSDNISTVNLKIKNPADYKSYYTLTSVTVNTGTITLNALMAMDLYQEVSSISAMTNMNTNYRLIEDIDCSKDRCNALGTYYGKLNGSNHTIYNLRVPSCFINSLRGSLKNINFVDFENTSTTSGKVGLVCTLESNGDIENVYVEDAYLTAYANNGVINLGGLAAVVSSGTITDSSVNGLSVNDETLTNAIPNMGGLVGNGSNVIIDTSLARNIYLDSYSLPADSSGIGGIIGVFASGKITNVYATGDIINNTQYLGGIAGRISGTTAAVSNAISKVNIEGDQDYIGGIDGYSAATNIVSKTIVLNNLSTKKADAKYFDRTSGTSINRSRNFAWDKQSLNNVITTDTNGEELLTQEDLWNRVVYSSKLGFGVKWALEVDNFRTGYIPYLNSTANGIIKGQGYYAFEEHEEDDIEDLKIFYEELFKLKDMTIDEDNTVYTESHEGDSYFVEKYRIDLTFENEHQYDIKYIVIDGISIDSTPKRPTNRASDRTTSMTYVVKPQMYYDTYIISEIVYEDENREEQSEYVNIVLNLPFYGQIADADDWANIESGYYENYVVTNDIDLSSLSTEELSRKSFGKLIGIGDTKPKIMNATVSFTKAGDPFIDTLVSNMTNIEFYNIKITNSASSGNNCGLIKYLNGNLSNMIFNKVNINCSKMNYVGIVSINQAPEVRNILVKESTIKGASYVGTIAKSNPLPVTQITLDDLSIDASGSYIGGLIGYESWKEKGTYSTYIIGNNVKINQNRSSYGNYIGGLFGYGSGTQVSLTNSKVRGSSYVGGITGDPSNRTNNNNYVFNSEVAGTNYVGGICGLYQPFYYSLVYNTKVTGNTYVGGIIGYNTWTIGSSASIKNTVIGKSSVGGVAGLMNSANINYTYVIDTKVTGENYVGGFLGSAGVSNNNIYYSISNAEVTATNNNAGGAIGYNNNINTIYFSKGKEYHRYITRVYHTIIAGSKVTAKDYAAGITGNTEQGLFTGQYYNVLVDANMHCEKEHCRYVMGRDDAHAASITRLYVYEGTSVSINGIAIPFSSSSAYANGTLFGEGRSSGIATLAELKTTAFYSNKLKPSGFTYNATTVLNNYPRPNGSVPNKSIDALLTGMPTSMLLNDNSDIGEILNNGNGANNYEEADKTRNIRDWGYLPLPGVNGRSLTGANGVSMLLGVAPMYHELPTAVAYSTGINKVNIEFSDVDEDTIFILNDKEYLIDKKTFTFDYDYDKDIDITLTDGNIYRKYKFNKDDLINTIYVVGNDYYHIKNNELLYNGEKTGINNAVHIYNNEVLLSDSRKYDTKTKEYSEINVNNFTETDLTPLYVFDYLDERVETYYSYSLVNGMYYEGQLFVKNGELDIIDNTITNKKNRIIIDSYNGKKYLLYLGEKGSIYSLKENINFPKYFSNYNIKDINSNPLTSTDLLFVLYENNNYVVFNYKTGNIVGSNFDYKPGLIEYTVDSYNEMMSAPNLNEPADVSYKEAEKLIVKLNETSIDDVLQSGGVEKGNISSSSNGNNSKYVVKFNNKTKDYEVLEIKASSKGSNYNKYNSVIIDEISKPSIQDVINDSEVLSNFYNLKKHKTFKASDFFVDSLFVMIGTIILISILLLGNIVLRKTRR